MLGRTKLQFLWACFEVHSKFNKNSNAILIFTGTPAVGSGVYDNGPALQHCFKYRFYFWVVFLLGPNLMDLTWIQETPNRYCGYVRIRIQCTTFEFQLTFLKIRFHYHCSPHTEKHFTTWLTSIGTYVTKANLLQLWRWTCWRAPGPGP